MNVIALVPSYSPRCNIANEVLSELRKFCNKVIVFSASDFTYENCEIIKFDPSIRQNLVFEPRKWITNNIDGDWDYVLYNEDDIIITKESFDNAFSLQQELSFPFVVGFNRFEFRDGVKYWIDQHPDHGVHTGNPGTSIISKNETCWIPSNFHSGNFLLPKSYAKILIQNNQFDTAFGQFGQSYCSILESGATSLYRVLIKVLPIDFQSVECQHLDNKYWHHARTPTTEILNKMLS